MSPESLKLKLTSLARLLAVNEVSAIKKFASHLKISLSPPAAKLAAAQDVKVGVKRGREETSVERAVLEAEAGGQKNATKRTKQDDTNNNAGNNPENLHSLKPTP